MPLQKVLNDLMHEIEYNRQQALKSDITDDPAAHKLTTMMSDGKSARYRYLDIRNGRRQIVRFCWSKHRNAAGYFLTWREVFKKRNGNMYATRDRWAARKAKKSARALAERRWEAQREKNRKRICEKGSQ